MQLGILMESPKSLIERVKRAIHKSKIVIVVTFEPFVVQTFALYFQKSQRIYQNMVGTCPHSPSGSAAHV